MHEKMMAMVEQAEAQIKEGAVFGKNSRYHLRHSMALSLAVIARAFAERFSSDDEEESQPGRIPQVFVNGHQFDAETEEMTYEEVVDLAGLVASLNPSVTFEKARDGREGILTPGMAVRVQDGTAFNAYYTGNG